MSITSLIILFLVATIVIYIRNNSGKKRDTPVRNYDNVTPGQPIYSAESGENEADDDIEGDPLFKKSLDKLTSVVMPDKYGDFNDAKKIGKTIAKINEEVSGYIRPGTEKYVRFFDVLYTIVMGRMLKSGNKMLISALEYTREQQMDWIEKGKSQTFVKGMSDDPLVAKAEVIMSVCEKCWFKNIKTTMFRKDLEKHNLPKSL